jgi:putative DNA primase/helicase
MVRSPLVWLGEPDPIDSMETVRAEDPELTNIREFFGLWPAYMKLDFLDTTARIIEIAEGQGSTSFNTTDLKAFLLRVAAAKGKSDDVSPDRLGWWLRRISGRVVNKRRLMHKQDRTNVATFYLTELG